MEQTFTLEQEIKYLPRSRWNLIYALLLHNGGTPTWQMDGIERDELLFVVEQLRRKGICV